MSTDVEEDEEEVGGSKSEEGVDLGDGGLLLQVVQDGVFGELLGDKGLAGHSNLARWRGHGRLCYRDHAMIAKTEGGRRLEGNWAAYLLINLADLSLSFVLEGRHCVLMGDLLKLWEKLQSVTKMRLSR